MLEIILEKIEKEMQVTEKPASTFLIIIV